MGKTSKKRRTKKHELRKDFYIVCEFIKKHWIISALILNASGVWFSLILTYCGETLHMVKVINDKRSLTIWGIIATVVFIGIVFFITIVQKYNEKNSVEEDASSGYQMLEKILVSLGTICNNKTNTQMKEITRIRNGETTVKPVFTNPCEQLKNILNTIAKCLSDLLSEQGHFVRESDVYVSLAYNFPLENTDSWHWAENNGEKGMAIDSLISSKDTTFSKLLDAHKPYLFFNSKQKAFKEKSYVPDESDQCKGGKLRGSIACYYITVKHNNECCIRAVLSVSTYEKCFSKVDDKEEIAKIEYNMYNHIVSNFEKQIKVELCNYYMQYLGKKMGCVVGKT